MDIEGTMKFILNQQAQFSKDILRVTAVLGDQAERLSKLEDITQRLGERQITSKDTIEDLAERQSKSEQIILQVRQTLLNVASAQEYTNRILATLAERQVETEQARRATEEAIRRLAERQKTTEENLNILLLTVERHISKHK